jgi:hypothetical protein
MTIQNKRIQSFKDKIAASIKESERQMEFAGVRMGVFARLKELERDRRRWARKLIELDPANENDYVQHLF